MTKTISKVRFVGAPGHYIGGIPARDLTPEEWERLSDRLREKAIASGLYKISKASSKKESTEDISAGSGSEG